ncbi:MAG: TadE family protein [Bacilli bacterium]
MKLKNKGQALVEFVIILPIVLMIIFVIIDFSNIFYQKNHLEGITNDIVTLKENGKSNSYIENIVNDKDVKVSFASSSDTLKIKTSKKVKLITPFSSLFFDNPFIIKTERTILYE